PRLTLAGKPDAGAGLHARRDVHGELALLLQPAGTVAGLAGILDRLAGAAAGRAGAFHREEALAGPDLSHAGTGRTGLRFRAAFRARAVAGRAGDRCWHVDRLLDALVGLFQRHAKVVAQVRSTLRARPPATPTGATAHEISEKVLEHVRERAREIALAVAALGAATRPAAHAALEGRVAEAVVGRLLLLVLQAFIGLVHFLELGLGLGIVLVAVGVEFLGLAAIGLLDLVGGSPAGDAQNLVKVAFRHLLPLGGNARAGPTQGQAGPLVPVALLALLALAEVLEVCTHAVVIAAARSFILVRRARLRLFRLVDRLAQLHRRIGEVLDTALDLAGILGLQGLFQRADGQFDGLDRRSVDLVAMLLDRLPRGMDEAFRLVPRLHEFLALLVAFGIGLGIADHLLDVLVRQATRSLDRDLLRPAGALVLGMDADDAVGVDVEGHLDLRHAARCGRDLFQVELAEKLVVRSHLALALEDPDRHRVLVVLGGREDLALL